MALAKSSKIATEERFITRHEVYTADECFLTGTAAEIIPVVKVDGRTIGTGKPGAVTLKMMKMFRALTGQSGVKYFFFVFCFLLFFTLKKEKKKKKISNKVLVERICRS